MGKRKGRKSSDIVSPNLRLREALRARLALEAKRNQVSLNAEMARRLTESLEAGPVKSIEAIAADLSGAWIRLRKHLEAAD